MCCRDRLSFHGADKNGANGKSERVRAREGEGGGRGRNGTKDVMSSSVQVWVRRARLIGCDHCSCLNTFEVKTSVWSLCLCEKAAGDQKGARGLFWCRSGGRMYLLRR